MKRKPLRVRPKLAYKLLGTELQLNPERVYDAVEARSIPGWKEKGLIFIGPEPGCLLDSNEYTIIKP